MTTIGTAAKRAGCKVETVRYYERIGLLKAPPKSASGRRSYGEGDIERLRFIRRCRDLGFALKDVEALVALSHAGEGSCNQAKRLAETQIDTVRKKVADLKRVEVWLQATIDECNASRATACPLIEKLSVSSPGNSAESTLAQ